jgi:hypothetical protein
MAEINKFFRSTQKRFEFCPATSTDEFVPRSLWERGIFVSGSGASLLAGADGNEKCKRIQLLGHGQTVIN